MSKYQYAHYENNCLKEIGKKIVKNTKWWPASKPVISGNVLDNTEFPFVVIKPAKSRRIESLKYTYDQCYKKVLLHCPSLAIKGPALCRQYTRSQ